MNPLRFLMATSAVFAILSVILGEVYDFYERYWWWGLFLHAKSGWMLALIASFIWVRYAQCLLPAAEVFPRTATVLLVLASVSLSVTVGVLWEFFEYAADFFAGLNMQKSGLDDTMFDLLACTAGSLVGSLALLRLSRGARRGMFVKWLIGNSSVT